MEKSSNLIWFGSTNHYTDFYYAEKMADCYDAVVSVGHRMQVVPNNVRYLYIDMLDIDLEDLARTPADFAKAPKMEHIVEFVSFIRSLEPHHKLLVHCTAGYARSPAFVAVALCERDKMPLTLALAKLAYLRVPDKLVPKPNDLILKHYERFRRENQNG